MLHAKALHGNPYDGHTLAPVIADIESSQVLRAAERYDISERVPLKSDIQSV